MLELPAHPIAHHCAADLTPDDKASSRTGKHPTTLGIAGRDVGIGEG
jgi:hypothetical protein